MRSEMNYFILLMILMTSIRKLFIPNTYEVYWTITPLEFLERMQKEYNRFWSEDRIKSKRYWIKSS